MCGGEPLRELYHNADVFILPTREDCFGLVILEAMCASLPVISSKYADGAFDLVAEGENGYIVDPEDTHAFAEKIDQIFADENRLKEMGTRSYERAHAFAFEEVAKGCIDALCYVMGKAVR
ncbi:MAG: glycosyltransferase [Roseburia hominis]